ncbi:hypothetical protein BS639_17320 [Rouxiella silvae]|jgi:hypothetical protein|uniref:ParE-like toxin domain-containing protein n=1 Tax=Rouxiella silvae TaxID=1646373 RepID=A0ABX3TXW9_9GAMM|nr:hypothetical protein [Rouxiella silvae]ORJ19939.1 hypothetical protein BS639_17320 [Rouxiella silvae]
MKNKLREIVPGFIASPSIPETYRVKALTQIQKFRRGMRNYTRLKDNGSGYIKINVGLFWRLLSRNDGLTWELMHHERYSSLIRKL